MEKNNNLHINVFGFEGECLFPLKLVDYDSISGDDSDVINLLLIYDEMVNHFCWIKNFNGLCFHLSKCRSRTHFCMRCLSGHRTPETLRNHQRYCTNVKPAAVKLPEPGETLRFKDVQRRMKMPYVIYADTESLIVPSSEQHGKHTVRNAEHVPCGVAYVVVRSDGTVTNRYLCRGESQCTAYTLNDMP